MELDELLKKAVPEIIEILEKRYTILKAIYAHQPVGRRNLAALVSMGERVVRSDTAVLRENGLLELRSDGMMLTREGEQVLEALSAFSSRLEGLEAQERQTAQTLKLRRVVIVPGNSETDPAILPMMGKAAARILSEDIGPNSTIAVTGGSSVHAAAHAYPKGSTVSNILVLPARGGIGKEVEFQSNNIAALFAKKLGGRYQLLHLPDQLTAEAAQTLLNDPDTRRLIEGIQKADILLFGIGRAGEMANRRNLTPAQMDALKRSGAAAEAFGYYFSRNGAMVFASNSIGLNIEDLKGIPKALGIAGGRQKAEAVVAVLTGWENASLVTDGACAQEILVLAGR